MTDVAEAPARRTMTPAEIASSWQDLSAEARAQIIDQTAHVHDVAHGPVITTEPLAHLKADAKKGAERLALQPRHAATAFTKLVLGSGPGQETVEVKGREGELSPPFPEGPIERQVITTWVILKAATKHAHSAGIEISAGEGFDPETVDVSGVICHDCGQQLQSDRGSERILVCPRVYGLRPTTLKLKHEDSAVECGLPA